MMILKKNKEKLKIDGEKIFLVPFDESHLNSSKYIGWLRDYDVMKTIGRQEYLKEKISFEKVKEYVENVWKSDNYLFLAMYCKEDNNFIGTMKLSINWTTKEADIGIMIGDKNYWGRGIATDAVAAVSEYSFQELKMRKLTAGSMEANPAMVKVFKKLGFVVEGVARKRDLFEGKYVDHIYFGCFLEEFNKKVNKAKKEVG